MHTANRRRRVHQAAHLGFLKTSLGKGLHTELKRILAAIFLSDGKAPMVIEVVDEAVFGWIKKQKRKGERR